MREGSKRAARSVGSHVPKGRAVTMSRAALFHQVPCRAPHHHSIQLSETAVRARSGAPRASMHPPAGRAHLSRFEIWIGNPDQDYAKQYCIDHHAGSQRSQRDMRWDRCGRLLVLGVSSAVLSSAYVSGPKRTRATWYPRVALTQSSFIERWTSGWCPPGSTYLRYRAC